MEPGETRVVVRVEREGIHRWANAPANRWYLRGDHRHLFHIEVAITVAHSDREIEFHDLAGRVKAWWYPLGLMDTDSCEDAATMLIEQLTGAYPGRHGTVGVFEDGEFGAVVAF